MVSRDNMLWLAVIHSEIRSTVILIYCCDVAEVLVIFIYLTSSFLPAAIVKERINREGVSRETEADSCVSNRRWSCLVQQNNKHGKKL